MKSGSRLEQLLTAGEFVVTAELGPPRSAGVKGIKRKGALLKDCVDAINVTDNQTAIVRVASMAVCAVLRDLGAEPVMQMVCRDRNRIALQSDVLGAALLGIKNILCLSGDHQTFGDHPTAKNVLDIDSIQLLRTLQRMRDERKFLSGEEIKAPLKIFIGAAANPFADPCEFRVIRLAKKVKAGADFIQTQCIFDLERFERWMEEVRERGLHEQVHILAGVTPLKSPRMARYMSESVAGMRIPGDILARMKDADDPKQEGVRICVETIERLKAIEGVRGIHIMAVAWEEIVPALVEQAGLKSQDKSKK